jgi:hypothetical protein
VVSKIEALIERKNSPPVWNEIGGDTFFMRAGKFKGEISGR